MVVGAYLGSNPKKTELINLSGSNSQCSLPDHPTRRGLVGFITSEGPVVCGGEGRAGRGDPSHCRILKSNKEWSMWHNMIQKRSYASAIKINDQQTLILGGYHEDDDGWMIIKLRSSEIMNDNGISESSIDAPVTMYEHCIIKLNNSMGLVTAGYQTPDAHTNSIRSSGTWYIDLQTLEFTEGPRLQQERHAHGCATLRIGNKIYGLVTGGYGSNYLDSTEILDLQQPNPAWTSGMYETPN